MGDRFPFLKFDYNQLNVDLCFEFPGKGFFLGQAFCCRSDIPVQFIMGYMAYLIVRLKRADPSVKGQNGIAP